MFEYVTNTHRMLAGVVGSTFAVAVAVGVGIVPGAAGAADVAAPAANAPSHHTVSGATNQAAPPVPAASTPAGSASAPAPAASTSAPATSKAAAQLVAASRARTAPVSVSTHATSTSSATRHTSAPTSAPAAKHPVQPAARPAPVVPPAAITVARRTPSNVEVQQAITGLKAYVHTIFSPTAAQVAQLGDQVCTAFDQGQTAAQVEATELATVAKLPFTTVLPGAAEYVTRTAVALYCPGHAAELG